MTSLVLVAAMTTWLKPLGIVVLGAVAVAAVLWAVGLAVRAAFPKVAAIAAVTAKEAQSQALFPLLIAVGTFLLLLLAIIPYNTFGEDIKVYKDEGLTLVTVLAIVLALWTASVSVADEIEGRTALTLLSKPIGRRQFLIGKFLGIVLPLAILFLVLGVVFLGTVGFKVVYDARETAMPEPSWRETGVEVWNVAPGLVLGFLEAVVLASISVAISTRAPMLPNLILCAAVYVLGHLMPLVLNSRAAEYEIVAFAARFFATVLPVLENFDMKTPIATGESLPLSYLPWAVLYCALYSSVAMLVALLLFEDRDLA